MPATRKNHRNNSLKARRRGTRKPAMATAITFALTAAALSNVAITSDARAYTNDKNWPCVQARVANLSPGQMWPGTTLLEDQSTWQKNKDVAALVAQILPRRVPLEETDQIIADFAKKHEDDNLNELLKLTFHGVLYEINSIRSEIITGLTRFMTRQKSLVERITENRHKASAYEKKDEDGTLTTAEDRELVKIEQALEWDQRIHEEREQSLEFVCESPVLLEQRLYAITKQLIKHSKESS